MDESEKIHIIEYILKMTDENNYYSKSFKHKKSVHRKYKLDDVIKYCNMCKRTWSKVPDWVDKTMVRVYPKGIIPKIGKKNKYCPTCEEKKNERT